MQLFLTKEELWWTHEPRQKEREFKLVWFLTLQQNGAAPNRP